MSNPVDVQWYTSDMPGSLVLNGQAGGIIGVLKACLIDGFGSKTVSSLVVASGVATATVSTGHEFLDHAVVLIEGSSVSELNGLKRVTYISATQFLFDAAGIADGTVMGTITAKVAPAAGWDMPFADPDNYKAVFRQTDVESSGYNHRFDDSADNVLLSSYSSMSDVDTGENVLQAGSGGTYVSTYTGTTANDWAVVASKFGCYFSSNLVYSGYDGTTFFGDLIPISGADIRKSIHCGVISTDTTASRGLVNLGTSGNVLSGNVLGEHSVAGFNKRILTGSYIGGATAPELSVLHGSQRFVGKVLVTDSENELRGYIPGLLSPYTGVTFSRFAREELLVNGQARKIMMMRSRYSTSLVPAFFVDITGPWDGT